MEKQNWKTGKNGGCVVSDILPTRPSYSAKDFESEKEYYGGYLIAESIPDTEKLNLIIAAPDMLKSLRGLVHAIKSRTTIGSDIIHELIQAEEAIKKATEL